VKKKMEMATHKPEFIPNWYENVWLKWTPKSVDFHPVTPSQYHSAVKEDLTKLPPLLRCFIKREKTNQRVCSIILLNWNSVEFLKRCLDLIVKNTHRPYEIIIVDNGSTKDNSVDFIKSLYLIGDRKVKKIFNLENKGFPAGVNQGIAVTENNDVCLLNVDAEVQDDWLENMYETLVNNPNCGIVGPLGNDIPTKHQAKGQFQVDTQICNVHGFCFLILRELIEKIGILDQVYGLGNYEDTDYCVRARLAGYEVYISAKSLVLHKCHQVCDLNNVNGTEMELYNREIYLNKFFGIMYEYGRRIDLFEDKKTAKEKGLLI
jgi:O-antigen biosynthesis protein